MENRKRRICRYWLALGLILPFASISAQPLSPHEDSIRAYCQMQLDIPNGVSDAQLDSTGMAKCIKLAVTQVCMDFPAYVVTDTVSFDTGSDGALLNSDFREMRAVFRIADTSYTYGQDTITVPIRIPIPVVNPDSLRYMRTKLDDDFQDETSLEDPTRYWTVGNYMFVHPTWSNTDSGLFLVTYIAIDTADGDTLFHIQNEYIPRVIEYATAKMYEILDISSKAAYYYSLYAVEVNKMQPVNRAVSYQEIRSQ